MKTNEVTEQKLVTEAEFDEAAGKKDACYHKVKSRYKAVSYTHLTLPTI